MKPFVIVGLLAALSAPSAFGQVQLDGSAIKQAVGVWDFLNDLCRGGSGDSPKTQEACDNRDKLDGIFRRAGWCYGRDDHPGYLKKWERCGAQLGQTGAGKPGLPTSSAVTVQPSTPMTNNAKGNCFLLAGMVSSVPTWRDNGVSISRAHANVEQALVSAGATLEEKKKWHDSVVSLYGSRVSSAEVEKTLRPSCEKMPGAPG